MGLRLKASRVRRRLGWAIAGALGLASTAFGQSAVLSGTVTDATGSTMASVSITATDLTTGVSREAQTGSDGKFKIDSLAVGHYTVKAISQGFKQYQISNVDLSASGEAKLNVRLEVGSTGGPMVDIGVSKPWWRRIF